MTSIRTIKRRHWLILEAISRLVEDKFFFQEYQKYLLSSPNIDKKNQFLYFISLNYIESATLGVFRQVDGNKKSQSMRNLLKDILKNYDIFTFKRFSSKYMKNPLLALMAKDDFAKFSTKDGKCINRSKIKSDIAQLIKITKPIVKYRHKVVGHKNKRIIQIKGTIGDLYNAIDFLERLAIKYELLLNQSGMTTLLAGNSSPNLSAIFK